MAYLNISRPAYSHLSHQFQRIQVGLTLSDKSNAGYHTFKHYFLKPLIRALRHMNDRELKLSIILGFVLALAGHLYQVALIMPQN